MSTALSVTANLAGQATGTFPRRGHSLPCLGHSAPWVDVPMSRSRTIFSFFLGVCPSDPLVSVVSRGQGCKPPKGREHTPRLPFSTQSRLRSSVHFGDIDHDPLGALMAALHIGVKQTQDSWGTPGLEGKNPESGLVGVTPVPIDGWLRFSLGSD